MSRTLSAVLAAVLLSGTALALEVPSDAPSKSKAGVTRKQQAPVATTARMAAGRATVTVKFLGAATDASVEVHGVDGLVVSTAAVPLSGGRFSRGATLSFDVAFTEGASPGQLTVVVSGDFSGARRIASTSFMTRSPSREQLKPGTPAPAAADSSGRRIKMVPAESR